MAAARVWEGEILASDIDPVAVEVAEANLAANGMAGRVTCLESAGFDHPDLKAAAPYDLIFANILKGPLVALAPDVAANLRPGGFAILSGINEVDREEIGDWTTLTLTKSA